MRASSFVLFCKVALDCAIYVELPLLAQLCAQAPLELVCRRVGHGVNALYEVSFTLFYVPLRHKAAREKKT